MHGIKSMRPCPRIQCCGRAAAPTAYEPSWFLPAIVVHATFHEVILVISPCDAMRRRVEARERLANGRLPLSENSILRWAGFSAEAWQSAATGKMTLKPSDPQRRSG